MAKVWVLDTDTKGTGARMVPLEDVLEKPDGDKPPRPIAPPPKPAARPEPEPEPRRPRRFRVVDAMTREVLADDAGARATLELLGRLRSLVDVSVYVQEPKADGWRPLTLAERQVMWSRRLGS